MKFDSELELFYLDEYRFDGNGNSVFYPMVDTFIDNNGNGMFDASINLKLDWHLPIAGQVDIYGSSDQNDLIHKTWSHSHQ